MPHPLTDAELHDKFNGYREEGWCNSIYCPDDMRAAYDLGRAEQLEQVIAHIKLSHWHTNDLISLGRLVAEWFVGPKRRIAELREAMRPTQENNK